MPDTGYVMSIPGRLCEVFAPNLGFTWDTTPNLVLNIYHGLF